MMKNLSLPETSVVQNSSKILYSRRLYSRSFCLQQQKKAESQFLAQILYILRVGISNSEMDGKYSAEMLKHLEKQSEILMEAYRSMSHELHRLQVEEEMLTHKFYEVTYGQGLNQKRNSEQRSSADVVEAEANTVSKRS
ncbi:hypothetical protein MKW98_012291 [Papaver atlanticum]|uniref:Uncharacterized protein n=1 Tax=Papaver atlanticum TaxID=357466 RepID=A0AAD4SZN1_9MAGN|nr:hypothetical protein MKW98_012291 [Papaver atlanticum]